MAEVLDTIYVEGTVSSSTQGLLLGSFDRMPEPGEDKKDVIVYYTGAKGDYVPYSFYICHTTNDGASWEWHPLVLALDQTRQLALDAVPKSTKVNGRPLSKDVWLSAEDVSALPATTKVPTKVSELSNDGVYITQDVSTLSNYWTKEQTSKLLSNYCRLIILDQFPEVDAIRPNCLYSIPKDGVRHLWYRVEGQWVQVV